MNIIKKRQFIYTISSNIISSAVSILVVFLLPKLLNDTGYAYYQLFLFYASYVGIMHFGWNDGIYLRNGGKYYNDLNKPQLNNQFWIQFFFELVIACVGVTFCYLHFNGNKFGILVFVMIYMIVSNLRTMILYILQATARLKEYSVVNVIGRVFFLITSLIAVIIWHSFWMVIIMDLLGRCVSLCVGCYYCADLVFYRGKRIAVDWLDIKQNIRDGMFLMTSNLAAQLIIGVIRYGVENYWDIRTFGQVSLGLTASNMALIFFNAIGIVIYPLMRRADKRTIELNYIKYQIILGAVLLYVLFGGIFVKLIVSSWLPEYLLAATCITIFFPATLFEARNSILIANILKTYRKERVMFIGNMFTLLLSVSATYINIIYYHNLIMILFSVPVLLASRTVFFDMYIKIKFGIGSIFETIIEIILITTFIIINYFASSIFIVFIVYGVEIFIYSVFRNKYIREFAGGIIYEKKTK